MPYDLVYLAVVLVSISTQCLATSCLANRYSDLANPGFLLDQTGFLGGYTGLFNLGFARPDDPLA